MCESVGVLQQVPLSRTAGAQSAARTRSSSMYSDSGRTSPALAQQKSRGRICPQPQSKRGEDSAGGELLQHGRRSTAPAWLTQDIEARAARGSRPPAVCAATSWHKQAAEAVPRDPEAGPGQGSQQGALGHRRAATGCSGMAGKAARPSMCTCEMAGVSKQEQGAHLVGGRPVEHDTQLAGLHNASNAVWCILGRHNDCLGAGSTVQRMASFPVVACARAAGHGNKGPKRVN
jgi:hypothetical protein